MGRIQPVAVGVPLLIGLLLVLAAPPRALPQEPPQTSADLELLIERLRQEQAEAEARKEQLALDQSRREEYLQEIGNQIVKGEQLLSAYERDIRLRSEEAERLREEIDTLSRRMEVLEAAVRSYVIDLYKHGRRRSIEVVLEGSSFTDTVRRLKAVMLIAERERESVRELDAARTEQSEKQAEVQQAIETLQQRRAAQRREQQRLNAAKAEAASELARIAQDQQEVQRRIEAAMAELDRLINLQMEVRRRERERRNALGLPSSLPLDGLESGQGELVWPLLSSDRGGRIVRGFGRQVGRDNTAITSKSVDILTSDASAEVVAVYNGQVLFIEWIAFLGTTVVIDHGGDYATAYSNLDGLRVVAEDFVLTDYWIAGLGDALRTSETQGRVLRFSIHKGGSAIDPMPWLPEGRR